MGRGNYIPPVSSYSNAEHITIYVDKEDIYGEEYWESEDSDLAYYEYEDFKINLLADFTDRFPTFLRLEKKNWLSDDTLIIAESDLCILTIHDDDSYIALSVIAKEDEFRPQILNLANRHIESYGKAMKQIILDTYGKYLFRTSAWTCGSVKREDVA